MPDITDTTADLEAVIAAARAHDATHLFWNVLFLKPSAQHAFFPFLERHFPHHTKRYTARFARSAFLSQAYKERIAIVITDLKRRHGFPDQPPFEMPAPVHETETETEQLPLFQIVAPVTPPARALPWAGAPPAPGAPSKRRLDNCPP